jgi:hypothetical protein
MKTLLSLDERLKGERGSAVIYVALVLFLLLGMAALAVDTGYNRVVRNQLQNAADAAALAACNRFYDRTEPPDLDDPTETCPDWSAATAEAADAIPINTADNNALQTGTTWVGWWDIVRPLNPDQWATPPSSPTCTPPTRMYGPAVRVTILKASGQNSGAMPTFFGKIFGTTTIDVDASATAVAASPGSARPEAIMPYAVSEESASLWNLYNSALNPIVLGDPYHCDSSGCYEGGTETSAGQFTPFEDSLQDVSSLRNIIDTGNLAYLAIGTPIWLQSGVERTLYDNPSANQVSIMSEYSGHTVALPVVEGSIPANVGAYTPISGFIGFHVICAGKQCAAMSPPPVPGLTTTNSEKIVVGYFTQAPDFGMGPIGPHFGPIDRCRLAR